MRGGLPKTVMRAFLLLLLGGWIWFFTLHLGTIVIKILIAVILAVAVFFMAARNTSPS